MTITIKTEDAAVLVERATTSKNEQGADVPTGARWTFYGDQADKHRAQFPEIAADAPAKAKAAELKAEREKTGKAP